VVSWDLAVSDLGHGDGEGGDVVVRRGGRVGGEGAVNGTQEGARRAARHVEAVDDEFGEAGPDAAPAAGEEAGARGCWKAVEAAENVVQENVGDAADAVGAPRLPHAINRCAQRLIRALG
jgi:hypothetical protein